MYINTNVGKVRQINQDCITCDDSLGFGIVADGIGGKPGGEMASKIAVDSIQNAIESSKSIKFSEIYQFMLTEVYRANLKIKSFGYQNKKYKGLGTTMDFVYFVGETINIMHIGDSRTYLFFNNHLFQLTIDHNVETLAKRQNINVKKKTMLNQKNKLTRGLGLVEELDPDYYQKKIYTSEIYLTASDGLFDMVEDWQIKKILNENLGNAHLLPDLLIDQANKNGGNDNISVLISCVVDG